MRRRRVDVAVIGGGAGGLDAAVAARKAGAEKVLLLERDERLGGITHQCIHSGFGLERYREELTGPEYIARVLGSFHDLGIDYRTKAMVLELTSDKRVRYVHPTDGAVELEAKTVVLAMGCREKTRPMIRVPGDRPAGIYTAGTAQRLLNIEGIRIGNRVVIIGSGDIGLIMARRCALSGMKVEAVVEVKPCASGLVRNVVQCLHDFDIPILVSTRVKGITGRKRVEKVLVAAIDQTGDFVPGTDRELPCDTVLIAAGLVPENELSASAGIRIHPLSSGPEIDQHMETSIAGVFAVGDVAYIHTTVDRVSLEAEKAGAGAAARCCSPRQQPEARIPVEAGTEIALVAPQRIDISDTATVELSFRVAGPKEHATVKVVGSSGVCLAEKRFRVLQPSQIETIGVPACMGAAAGERAAVGGPSAVRIVVA